MTDTLSPDRDAKIAEDETRDIKLAELLGAKWETKQERPGYAWLRAAPIIEGGMGVTLAILYPDGEVIRQACARYSTDPVAFEALMEEIGRRGLGAKYVSSLAALLDSDPMEYSKWSACCAEIWTLFSAPQSQRAAAALAVLTEAAT